MALKPLLAKTDYTISSEKDYLQRLGEILHFCFNCILRNHRDGRPFEVENLIHRALLFFPYLSEKTDTLRREAREILDEILRTPSFSELLKLVKGAKCVYSEIEIFSRDENRLYRPDFLIEKDDLLIVLEFKLREEDFSEEQIEKYVDLMRELSCTVRIHAYLVTFIPFNLKLYRKIEPGQGCHGSKGLSGASQLSLFKEPF